MPLKPKSGKRGSKNASFDENFTGTEDELGAIIRHNIRYFGKTPPADDEETAERITEMFQYCADNQSVPTVEKLALCLGIDRNTLFDWQHKESKGKKRSVIIKNAKEIIAAIDAEAVVQGKLNNIAYIFRAQNYYGLSNNVTVEHKASTPLGEAQDQSMLVGALLKQLQGQATIDLPSDYQPQPEQATIATASSDFTERLSASDYQATMPQEPSDYAAGSQATMSSDYETEKPLDFAAVLENIKATGVENDAAGDKG